MEQRGRSVEAQIQQRNIARRLFGEDVLVEVDRFTILERLGMGAMGAVYRAYDPVLDRAVALKVLHPNVMAAAAEVEGRMRREAQALARLAHPNVVTVHEVGGEAHSIWIAMELVDGGNLAERLAALDGDARFDAAVDAMLQAGEGLHAAHGEGVVHRDMKPANVLVGRDGRTRVADFGLACRGDARGLGETDADAAVGVGTPAYMAPEQWTGSVDARADQYAYCVVFWEALFGVRPDLADLHPPPDAPARAIALAEVLRRGLQENREHRWPSMHELLEAIRDVVFERPRRRRRRLALLSAIAGVVGTAFVATWMSSVDPCSGAAERLHGFWDEAARDARFADLAGRAAYAQRAVPRIVEVTAAFTSAWTDAYRTTCMAHVRKELSDHVFERRMSCLERAGASYAVLADRASQDDVDVSALVRAAAGLPRPQACAVVEGLPEDARPPERIQVAVDQIDTRLARSRTYLDAGAALRALELADEAVSSARALEFGPVTARALHERGRIHALAGPLPELTTERAIEDLREATQLALLDQDYPLAVEAWSRRAWLEGTHGGDPAPLLQEAQIMIAMVRGAAPSSAEEALLYNNLAGVELARSDRARARELLRRSVDISASLTYPPRELDNAAINLALVTDDNTIRDALFRRLIEEQRALLGAEHPHVLQIELLFAVTTASTTAAEQALADLVESYRQYHPELAKPRFEAHIELAWSELGRGRRDGAAPHFRMAAALNAWDPLARDVAAGFASLAEGDLAGARSMLQGVAASTTTNPWQHDSVVHARLGLAVAAADVARLRDAAAGFADLEHLPTAALSNRLAFASAVLASVPAEGAPVAALAQAIERWRSGEGDRGAIVAAVRAL